MAWLKTILIGATMSLTGCIVNSRVETFNPEAVYQVGPVGLWTDSGEVVRKEGEGNVECGRMFILPGSLIVYEADLVN